MKKEFFQNGPALHHPYSTDFLLTGFLRALPEAIHASVEADLNRFGNRVLHELEPLAAQAEREKPEHIPYDPWGRRVDELRVSSAWQKLADVAAEEGIVATGYERKYGEHSRLVQFAKLYLYHPSSSFFSCPLAMTDGAARAIELYGDAKLKEGAFRRLTSRDPSQFWTSGQWMTERTGGSDVSGTTTIAKPLGGDRYALHGTKWFTSATTSQMAMTLARIEGAPAGSKGLSLFYLELRDPEGKLKNIEVHRLKDKLGTRALPTAELTMNGTEAWLVGGEGGGVKKISSLFNITRMYNSVCALSAMRRALALAHDYSKKRSVFGAPLWDHALHAETLADLWVEFEGNFLLTFTLARLLGLEETGKASADDSALLRLLTPIAKLYTAKCCMAITSEVVEIFGGVGYTEDSGIPKLLRDAQVFSIWEGATNVLALDVLRAIEKENGFTAYSGEMKKLAAGDPELLAAVKSQADFLETGGAESVMAGAREFAYSLARVFAGALLKQRANETSSAVHAEIAARWCRKGLGIGAGPDAAHRASTKLILSSLG